jgi:hypothetical protein
MTKIGPYKRALMQAEELARARRIERDGMVIHEYPDYDTYRAVQMAGNKAKLKMQFVKESHIRALAAHLTARLGPVRFGLCHGTRGGLEQGWFAAHLGGAEVIGTEISDTATQFPNTVQWDFHDVNPDWVGRADFVYSNSWDHAFDPVKAFSAWMGQLRPGGLMLLDYTRGQSPAEANALDPFGITWPALAALLGQELAGLGALEPPLDLRANPDYAALVAVMRRA